jgi:hypothetical protein
MMREMCDVVVCEEFEGDGIVRADAAGGLELGCGQMRDHVGEEAVVGGPESDELEPVGGLEMLGADIAILVVAGKVEDRLKGGADETLVVVGGRVDEVAEELLAGPAAGADGFGAGVVFDLAEDGVGGVNEL